MRIPISSYRLQLRPGFGFAESAAILPYLKRLGISDVYASPLFRAQPGSLHGYDVLDPNLLNPELGSETEWRALADARRALNMGWLQDIVPNHMAFSALNPLLTDIFENGPRSAFYHFFDIQWDHPDSRLKGKVRTPFLGDTLENCLDRGEITLEYNAEGLAAVYYGNRYALALNSYAQVFETTSGDAEPGQTPEIDVWRRGIQQLIQVAAAAPAEERAERIADAKRALRELYRRSPRIRDWVDRHVNAFNAPQARARMQLLMQAQHFELCYWQEAAHAINYRRFFSINGLIGVRQEDAQVFAYTHRLIRRMIEAGDLTGLRVDHIDGLADPGGYLAQLRQACADTFIVVEKILALDEALEGGWPIQGTTGYEFAAHLNALFTLPDYVSEMTAIYQEMTGGTDDFEALGRQSKAEILETEFSGDLDNLVRRFSPLLQGPAEAPDDEMLRIGLAQILIHLPVYRTYLSAGEVRPADREVFDRTVDVARRQGSCPASVFDRLMNVMLRTDPVQDERRYRTAMSAFEQLSAALAAKGIEDTALYRYNRLSALNEVGGAPERFDGALDRFHRFAARRPPGTLNTLSTHDTKRSADVRARMLVIAEIPDEWRARVTRWRRMNAARASRSEGRRAPDPEIEYLLYQTLIGTYPEHADNLQAYAGRIADYAVKAAREAKRHTCWSEPVTAYESALRNFIAGLLTPGPDNLFLDDLAPFAAGVAHRGRYVALAQCLIHLTAPGVPDLYQGGELFDDSLVDPDNRREVDFELRAALLDAIIADRGRDAEALAARLTAEGGDRIKLYITYVALQQRQMRSALYRKGRYQPLNVHGRHAPHVVAFAREFGGSWALTVVPRFLSALIGDHQAPVGRSAWADTGVELPPGSPAVWVDQFTGQSVSARGTLAMADLLARFPVALITGEANI